jgi:hypothetical protein
LNGYVKEANDLGFAVRANLMRIGEELTHVGIAMKLMPSEYRLSTDGGIESSLKPASNPLFKS